MDHLHFDNLLRNAAYTPSTRRTVALLLAGSALGEIAARLGLSDIAEAKSNKPRAKHKAQRGAIPAAKRQEQVQAEGKGKKKHKKKRTPSPECDPLTTKLCGQCEEPVCAAGDWVCRSNGEKECPDGSCVAANACCDGKYRCEDGTCIDPFGECCPDQKLCASNCIAKDACCHLDPTPLCGPCDGVVCEAGAWKCQARSDVKACADGTCVPVEACCPDTLPECGQCEYLECVDGKGLCRPIVGQCEAGGVWDAEICRCRYCREVCDSSTHMCQSIGCPQGSLCEAGHCIQMCPNPQMPQLCCLDDAQGTASRCRCRGANEICYSCGGVCACFPGQTCCPPDAVRAGICPQACLEAEICQHCEGPDCP